MSSLRNKHHIRQPAPYNVSPALSMVLHKKDGASLRGRDAARYMIQQCDNAAWPSIVDYMRKGACLLLLEGQSRFVLATDDDTFGPSLSAGRVYQLAQCGVLRSKNGASEYSLSRPS